MHEVLAMVLATRKKNFQKGKVHTCGAGFVKS